MRSIDRDVIQYLEAQSQQAGRRVEVRNDGEIAAAVKRSIVEVRAGIRRLARRGLVEYNESSDGYSAWLPLQEAP
jgi:hypothetical protein